MLCDFWVHCSCIAFTTSKQQMCICCFLKMNLMRCLCSAISKATYDRIEDTVNWLTLKILCKLINVYCLKYYISQLYFFLVQFLERSSVMLWLAAEGQNSNLAEPNGWRDSIIQLLGRMSERSQFIETSIWRIAGKTFYVKIPTGYSNFVLTKQDQYHY